MTNHWWSMCQMNTNHKHNYQPLWTIKIHQVINQGYRLYIISSYIIINRWLYIPYSSPILKLRLAMEHCPGTNPFFDTYQKWSCSINFIKFCVAMYFTKGSYNNNVPCRTWSFSFSWAAWSSFKSSSSWASPWDRLGTWAEAGGYGVDSYPKSGDPQMLIWLILTFAGHKRIYPGTPFF